jgi:hypothetical protein
MAAQMLNHHIEEIKLQENSLNWTPDNPALLIGHFPRLEVTDGITSGMYTDSVTLLGVILTLRCPSSQYNGFK